MLTTLISRVDIRPDYVEIGVRRSRALEDAGDSGVDHGK